ncbi:hypothetical protein ACFLZ4_00505 [Patescibacteria group bacterium]
MGDNNTDITTVVNSQDDTAEEEHEELPSDVADAIGMRKKKDNRPPADDYVSELENPDLETKDEI